MINRKMRYKQIALLVFFILAIVSLNFVSSLGEVCIITNRADCSSAIPNGKIIMGLSDVNNSHGELASSLVYNKVLCCNVGGTSTACDGSNKILGLSSNTNAHSEVPDAISPVYTSNDICYEGFKNCRSTGGSCASGQIPIIYLSSSLTNAHFGGEGSGYPTKICCEISPAQENCVLSTASWGDSSCTYPGTDVPMTVTGSQYCNQETSVKYEVYEGNTLKDTINGKYDKAFWTAISASSNKNYYFNATPLFGEILGKSIKSNIFTVYNKDISSVCTSLTIATCEDYDKIREETCTDAAKDACNANSCNVINTPEGSKCSWNDAENKCETVEIVNHCGDNSLEMPPEECDGIRTEDELAWSFINFGEYGTSDQPGSCVRYNSTAFKGGELGCYHPNPENPDQCTINTFNCEPINPGICGDGKINAKGEKCDLTNLNGKTCVSFGYDAGGTLSCKSDCTFDKSQCTKEGNPVCIPTGECVYTQTRDSDGCEDGFLDYNLSFTWRNKNSACPTSTAPAGKCKSGPQRIECPAEIPIPFFDWITLVAAILVIGLVYTGISLANKKKSR